MDAKKQIKVLYLSSWEIGANGQGDVSFIFEQVDTLSNMVEASFIDPKFISYPRYLINEVSQKPNSEKITNLWNEKVLSHRLNIPRFSSRITKRSLLEEVKILGKKLAPQIRKLIGPIDLIHAHVVLPAGLIAAEIATELNIPFIIQEHSAPFEMHLDTLEKVEMVKYSFEKSSKIICVGPDLYEKVIPYAPKEKTIVIPNLLRTDLFKSEPMPPVHSSINLVSIGGLVKRKGYPMLIEALSILNNSDSKIKYHLKIIGEGRERKNIEHLITSFNQGNYISLEGHLEREKVKLIIQNSHIYLHASERETFGLAPAEALSVGRPVITTKCGGPEFYVNEENGKILNARDPFTIAQAIEELGKKIHLYDPNALHQAIDKSYGPKEFLNNFQKVYESTTSSFGFQNKAISL